MCTCLPGKETQPQDLNVVVGWPPCMTLSTYVVLILFVNVGFLCIGWNIVEKYLQAQFLTIHLGFTLGFRLDTSKSCSVVTCSTFSWWPSSRSVGLERGWCALGVFAELQRVWDCYKWVLSCILFMVVGKSGGKLQTEVSLRGLHCTCCAFIYSVISLSLWNTFIGSSHTRPLWIVAFSVSG